MTLALFAKSATRSFVSAQATRGFASSALARRDIVQETYLRELKAYKAPAQSADAHKGQVREFHNPSPPKAPSVPSSSSLASELDAYASSEPDVAEVSKSSDGDEAFVGGGAKEFLEEARRPYPKEEAHH